MKTTNQSWALQRSSFAIGVCAAMLFVGGSSAYALDSMTLPAGVPKPSFADSFVVIDDAGNPDDGRATPSYGGVGYKYRVSATQITVGDWVAFLNAVDPGNTMGFGPIGGGCGNDFCFAAYAYSGGTWSVTAFNQDGMNMTASEAAKMPIDWLSLNMVARYMNWLATGDINQGAFTFSDATSGNAAITSFDANYPGPRLPLEDELYKAMFWDKSKQAYNTYSTNNLLGDGTPVLAGVNGSGIHNSNAGGALVPGYGAVGDRHYAQVGQETGNPWGLFDVAGNRHETTLEPSAPTATILRGAAAFGQVFQSRYEFRDNLSANGRYVSVGYRVWMGVSASSGVLRIKKVVANGTDGQAFSFNLECTGDNFDKTGILLKHDETYESDAIPVGTQCTVTEVAPTAPTGFTYSAAQYAPGQTVTIEENNPKLVTVTNTLQPVAAQNVDLEITKVADKPNVVSGDTVRYTITLTNKGPGAATGVEVTDQLPAGVTYNAHATLKGAYDKNTGIWTVGALAKNDVVQLTIDVTVD
ncbi:DUF5979 domain-containing protein [Thiothrix sp.]|uniref:DUF5979 domain-containing protein n=1 Tax=Thiothrix sp. TaxID=1032 RepID=UPI00257FEBF1|nr:DUF5979 domain-containing protein [Thiothrix sp.]